MFYQYVNVVIINKVVVIEFNYGCKFNVLSKVFIDDFMQVLSDFNWLEICCIILCVLSGFKVFFVGYDIYELLFGGCDLFFYDDLLC